MDVSLIGAFLAGIASFISPCVLPLAPPYLAYIGGTTLDQLDRDRGEIDPGTSRRVILAAVCFVLGLASVFTLLGLASAAGGGLLLENKDLLALGSGLLIYAFGLHFWGLRRSLWVLAAVLAAVAVWAVLDGDPLAALADLKWPLAGLVVISLAFQALGQHWRSDRLPILDREARFEGPREAGSLGASFLIGMAFAFGWTPCIGPILGSILSIAAQQDSLGGGTLLLLLYGLGLGMPFLLAAFFMRPFLAWARGFRRHMGKVEAGMGVVLIAMGTLMATGGFEWLAWQLLDAFPGLAAFG